MYSVKKKKKKKKERKKEFSKHVFSSCKRLLRKLAEPQPERQNPSESFFNL